MTGAATVAARTAPAVNPPVTPSAIKAGRLTTDSHQILRAMKKTVAAAAVIKRHGYRGGSVDWEK